MKHMNKKFLLFLPLLLAPSTAFASELDKADTAWLLVATALVMLMTPAGLALFYGGLTRQKSVLNTIGMSFIAYSVATVAWVVAGYSIAFGDDSNPVWGGLSKVMLLNISMDDLVGTVPELLFVAFQGTFAAITIAIVSGAIVERIRYSTWLIFSFLWVIFCYSPIAHFVWGGGFLSHNGELDFAGGTVVHVNAGVAGLVLVLLLGKRKDYDNTAHIPYSIKFSMLGAGLLWFGWFGFNAGSALAADQIAANAILVTNVAAAMGCISWLMAEWVSKHPRSVVGTGCGLVAGLVGITPAAGFVDVTGALIIGLGSGVVGFIAVHYVKRVLKYDDTLDAFGIHGVVGVFGALATGLLANPKINEATGVFYGNFYQIVPQIVTIVVTVIYTVIVTAILFYLAKFITRGARVSEEHELVGLDKTYHRELDTTGSIKDSE